MGNVDHVLCVEIWLVFTEVSPELGDGSLGDDQSPVHIEQGGVHLKRNRACVCASAGHFCICVSNEFVCVCVSCVSIRNRIDDSLALA